MGAANRRDYRQGIGQSSTRRRQCSAAGIAFVHSVWRLPPSAHLHHFTAYVAPPLHAEHAAGDWHMHDELAFHRVHAVSGRSAGLDAWPAVEGRETPPPNLARRGTECEIKLRQCILSGLVGMFLVAIL